MKNEFRMPNILECVRFSNPSSEKERLVRDYEIDFNITGNRTMWVDGKEYKIKSNSIVCRLPGQTVKSIGNINMFMMTLDFSDSVPKQSKIRHILHPVQQKYDSYIWDVIPTYFEPIHADEIFSLYKKLIYKSSFIDEKNDTDLIFASLMHLIISDAYAEKCNQDVGDDSVFKVISYMTEHFDEKIELEKLASSVFLNKSYLIRLFKKETGITPIQYLKSIRMKHAALYLKNTSESISQISKKCGYESESYFILDFKKHFEITPDKFR